MLEMRHEGYWILSEVGSNGGKIAILHSFKYIAARYPFAASLLSKISLVINSLRRILIHNPPRKLPKRQPLIQIHKIPQIRLRKHS